ncbi:MAG: leucine-rich repeat domain-containing protein, partial [Muribaculaceae bacterium]|nr:leucine-rich repeat domain-containing protein [Muribaculaceae bacterium]
LKAFNIAEGNPVYKAVDCVLYDKALTVLLMFPNGKQGACQIPSSVTRIDDYALNSCAGLTSVNIPEKLKEIGMSAFANCYNLADVDFSEGLEIIGENAFYGCSALAGTIHLPQTVKLIGKWAFNYCSKIDNIILPNGNTVIGEAAFSNTSVSNMIFPEGITELGIPEAVGDFSIMDGCSKLTCVVLPSTLEKLRPFAVSSSRFATIYSNALVPPVLVGYTANSIVSSVMVPKGKAAEYEQAWGDLYPMADFVDVLPGAPEVAVSAIKWDVYSATGYPATPVRYQLSISTASGSIVKDLILDAEGVVDGTSVTAPASGSVTYAVSGISSGEYTYDLKGYAAEGQLVYAHTGDITVESTGIDDVTLEDAGICVSGNTISTRDGLEIKVYSFDGSLVAVTSGSVSLPAGMYVVMAGGKAMKIAIR